MDTDIYQVIITVIPSHLCMVLVIYIMAAICVPVTMYTSSFQVIISYSNACIHGACHFASILQVINTVLSTPEYETLSSYIVYLQLWILRFSRSFILEF